MKRQPPQPDLFAPPPSRPRNFDERRLVDTLRRAVGVGKVNGMTPDQLRRSSPRRLPRITVPK